MKTMIKTLTFLMIWVMAAAGHAASVNLNTASKAELMTLKGVGEARAEAIMKHRRGNKFKSAADIKNVPGIGEQIYKDNARSLKVSGATTAKPASTAGKKSASKSQAKKKASSKKTAAKKKLAKEKSAKKAKDKAKDKAKKKAKKKTKKKAKKSKSQ